MDAMRWLRPGRVTRREAEHLLDGSPPAGVRPHLADVADLLAAAAAPARSGELAGARAAVATFRREYAAPDVRPRATPDTRARAAAAVGSRRRRVVVVALSAVIAVVGGTAYAAGTGRLPDPVQRRLHEALAGVGIPPPEQTGTPSPDPVPPSPSGSVGTSAPDARLIALCRAWQAARTTPGAPQPRPDERRALADAAGGAHRVEQFCAALAGAPTPGAGAPQPVTPGPQAPGTVAPGKPENPKPTGPPATPPGRQDDGGNGNRSSHGRPGNAEATRSAP